jgi:hypothetical protein
MMTSDNRFLRDARIEPCELDNWMSWRQSELDALRSDNAALKSALRESERMRRQWRAAAVLAGLLAIFTLMQPVLDRVMP